MLIECHLTVSSGLFYTVEVQIFSFFEEMQTIKCDLYNYLRVEQYGCIHNILVSLCLLVHSQWSNVAGYFNRCLFTHLKM